MPARTFEKKIADAVRAALASDPRLHRESISLEVLGGIVTLRGTVGSYLERMAAAEDAWSVRGVAEVRNHLQVRPDRVRQTAEIAADLVAALARDPRVNRRDVVAEVAEGVVRLSGTVSSEVERKAAEEIAWGVPGVVAVSNEIVVSPSGRRPDSDVERDVRAALDEDARLSDPARIKVSSVAGTVRLEGSVPTAEEREAAEKDAWWTAGVVYVENRLRLNGARERPAAA